MNQLSRIIELIRVTGQPGYLLEGEREPLAIMPLAAYEKLIGSKNIEQQAEVWSNTLQEQINSWQKEQIKQSVQPSRSVKTKSVKTAKEEKPIHQAKPDLAEIMEEEIMEEEVEEYLPEPMDESENQ